MTASQFPSRRLTGVVLSIALAVLPAACAGGKTTSGGSSQDHVASLASSSPTATRTPAADERPLIRSDTSKEEELQIYYVYEQCLKDHGDPRLQKPGLVGPGAPQVNAPGRGDEPPKVVAAQKACANKFPESIVDRARRTDPRYADKLRDWITCMRAAGIDVSASSESGKRYFGSLDGQHLLEDPHVVIQGDRMLHVKFKVRR
jgi:hypothetical protein